MQLLRFIVDVFIKDLKILPHVDINRFATGKFHERRIPISFACEKDDMKKASFWMRKPKRMLIPSLSKLTKLLQLKRFSVEVCVEPIKIISHIQDGEYRNSQAPPD